MSKKTEQKEEKWVAGGREKFGCCLNHTEVKELDDFIRTLISTIREEAQDVNVRDVYAFEAGLKEGKRQAQKEERQKCVEIVKEQDCHCNGTCVAKITCNNILISLNQDKD